MTVRYLEYAKWTEFARNPGTLHFHIREDTDMVTALCGNGGRLVATEVDPDDYPDWEANYLPTSREVSSVEEAVELSIGTSFYPPDPREKADGKLHVVTNPSTEGFNTWFTSRGDDVANGTRGTGPQIRLDFTGPTQAGAEIRQSMQFKFIEPVEVHDGALWYTPVSDWTAEDEFSFGVNIPPNNPTYNTTNTGNVNLVDTGSGFNLIVPANGNGTHDLDLTSAVPVPADGNGYWEVNLKTGDVSPSPFPGKGDWNLLDIPIKSWFIRNVALGNPLGVFEIDVYRTEWIHPRWTLEFEVVRRTVRSSGTFTITGWLMLFRPKVS